MPAGEAWAGLPFKVRGRGSPAQRCSSGLYAPARLTAPACVCVCSPPPRCSPPLLLQLKDKWGFRMTARYDMYAEQLAAYVKHDYQPQVRLLQAAVGQVVSRAGDPVPRALGWWLGRCRGAAL